MNIEEGELLTLDDNKEYVVFKIFEENNEKVLYLMSNFKPVEVFFAKQIQTNNGEISLKIINDQEEKEKYLKVLAGENLNN